MNHTSELSGMSLAQAAATDAEFARLIDDRLDTENQTELVIHLEPVVLHALLDPGPGSAIFRARGQDFAVEVAMQTAAQKREDVLGGEMQQRMIEQPWEQFG